ncbi:hypothetical protein [Actinomadura madurae]|uniref:hypothetical protein n=1 Tax=Actinomadura madurae TaxID=1993 RepID=UPI0035572FA2
MELPAARAAPLLRELPGTVGDLRIVLNHLGFAPHDMRVDEHGRPRSTTPSRRPWQRPSSAWPGTRTPT